MEVAQSPPAQRSLGFCELAASAFYAPFTNWRRAHMARSQCARQIGMKTFIAVEPRPLGYPPTAPRRTQPRQTNQIRTSRLPIGLGSRPRLRPGSTKKPQDVTFFLVALICAAALLYLVMPSGKSSAAVSSLAPTPGQAVVPTQASSGYAPSDNADYRGTTDFGGRGDDGSYPGPGDFGGPGGV
jgi:hypothetical protein